MISFLVYQFLPELPDSNQFQVKITKIKQTKKGKHFYKNSKKVVQYIVMNSKQVLYLKS